MKNSKRSYPLEIRVAYFKDGVDTRDSFNEWYVISKIVNNKNEESEFYEGLNHEANIVIDRI
jgi:hypothetical protein